MASSANKLDAFWWYAVFTKRSTSQCVPFSARFKDSKGVEHRLDYWREDGTRLRRNTDGNVDLMVKKLSNGEYRYHVLDHRKNYHRY